MPWFTLVCLLPAAACAWVLTAVVRRVAVRVGLVDRPGEARKVHTAVTPLGGGVAVWAAVTLPLAAAVAAAVLVERGVLADSLLPAALRPHTAGVLTKAGQLAAVLAAGTLLAAVGLWDDFRGLRWQPRLAAQFLAAGLAVAAGVRLTLFVEDVWFGAAVTVLWLMTLTNALNFLDNMNGLCGGVALIAAALTAAVMLSALPRPHWFVAGVMLVLAGSLAGFLVHNWPGRIFLGDAGSTFVGFLLAAMTVLATFYEPGVGGASGLVNGAAGGSGGRHVLLAPLCILAVPLYDFASVMAIRLSSGRSPFHADRNHFSHRLNDLGLSRPAAVLTVWLATLTTGLAGLLLYRVPDWAGAVLVCAVVAGVLAMVAVIETAARRAVRRKR